MPSDCVVLSMLNRDDGSNEKRGSGVGGVENRLGRAERRENANRMRRGRSWTKRDRGVACSCCCLCGRVRDV
jgi:hypothetical protein